MNQVEPGKLQPALIGGVALGVASAIPFLNCINCACCALVIGGGFLAAYLYLKDCPPTPDAPYGDGAVLGLLTGVIGAVVTVVIAIPFNLLFSSFDFGTDLGPLEDALSQSELPPEFQEAILNFVSTLSSQELTAAALVMQLIIYLVIFSIFAMIGALIGVAVMHKKQAPPPPPPVQ